MSCELSLPLSVNPNEPCNQTTENVPEFIYQKRLQTCMPLILNMQNCVYKCVYFQSMVVFCSVKVLYVIFISNYRSLNIKGVISLIPQQTANGLLFCVDEMS